MSITGEKAWAVLGLGIVAYEIFSEENQLLSVAVDRFLVKHPILTRLCIAAVALHLMNALPTKADPIHLIAVNANKAGVRTKTFRVQREAKRRSLQANPRTPHRIENGSRMQWESTT